VTRANPAYPVLLVPQWCSYWYAGIADDARGLRLDALEPRTRTMVAKGERLARRGRPTEAAREAWRLKATRFFDEHDVVVMPVAAQSAPRMGALERAGFTRTYLAGAHSVPFTQAWNLSGFPAISVPFGLDDQGLPYAVQLATTPGREALLLAVAAQLEAIHGPLHAWRNSPSRRVAMVME
jgi:amidase